MSCGYLNVIFIIIICSCFPACFGDALDNPKQYGYLDEIINEIKNETWDVTETACKNRTLLLLENVKNFTLWATWVWDSMDIKPVGSLYGSQYQLGNYDQCLTSWTTYPELRTQYCLANIKIERKSRERRRRGVELQVFDPYGVADDYIQTPSGFGQDLNLITWGVCVPASCDPQSVQRFVTKLLKHSHFGTVTSEATINIESCDKANRNQSYSIGDYLFFGLILSCLCVAIISTYIYSGSHKSKDSTSLQIACCFSVPENFKKLTDTNDQELTILNGIRCLSCAVIVGLHQIFIIASTAIFNGAEIEKIFNHYTVSWALHIDTVVDTFFMMSGLLLANTCLTMKEITVRNLGKQLLKRYFRLTTTFAVILCFLTTIAPKLGSGPLVNKAIDREVNACKKNWWLSLLTLNNYIDKENFCDPVIWSINCDFHFSIVGTALVYFYSKSRRAGFLAFVAMFIVALVTPGVYTALYQIPPLLMVNIRVFKDYRKDVVFKEMYIPSHNRIAAYLVGMMFGYVLYVYKPHSFKKSISRTWSIVGTSVGLGLMIGILELGSSYYSREYSRAEAVLYAALNRPLWAFAVGIIVLCCVYGTVPFVKGSLCWSVFRPLSRLTFGVYMVHAILWMGSFYLIRTPYHIGLISVIIDFFGVLTISVFISLILWLFVEAPAANFVNFLLRRANKS